VKQVIGGLLLAVAASSACAGHRYVEVWDPPEARPLVRNAKSAHRQLTHRRISAAHAAFPKRQRLVTATAGKIKAPDMAGDNGKHGPSFDSIPRQVTPEGNVLRVHRGQIRVQVER
jgi:hypothetical protein